MVWSIMLSSESESAAFWSSRHTEKQVGLVIANISYTVVPVQQIHRLSAVDLWVDLLHHITLCGGENICCRSTTDFIDCRLNVDLLYRKWNKALGNVVYHQ